MAPKRKAKAAPAAGAAKKSKKADQAPKKPTTVKQAIKVLKQADKGKKKRVIKVDDHCPMANCTNVYDDFDCMLNQTNIGQNNNKYYVIQLLKHSALNKYYTWNRWGRVGEPGANKLQGPMDVAAAQKDFEKKFKDKTRNDWETRDNFVPVKGKYTLLEMDDDGGEEDVVDAGVAQVANMGGKKVAASKLDKPSQNLINLIFNTDMFNDAMAKMELDVKKMPLGKLSKSQIAKGFECLEELEKEIKKSKSPKINELSSRFYTLIPHSFGRSVPPAMRDLETVRQKMDMLLVLGDIEIAQSMQKGKEKSIPKDAPEIPHPLDINYGLLNCELDHLKPKSEEFQVLEKYLRATEQSRWGGKKVIHDIWKVDRKGEDKKFLAHDKIDNRKLLWHGTNVAVVAAILKSGLRIMPHSGGRVGKGIYFASENDKSAGYVGSTNDGTGIMFLNEVALGRECHITQNDGSLTAAPKGYDCVIARGQTEPDPKLDTHIKLGGKKVVVPQGKPVKQSKFNSSHFGQSEYLIYKESQCRIRYLLKMKMH